MNHLKLKTGILAMAAFCFAACNDNSSGNSPDNSPASDSSMMKPSDTSGMTKDTGKTSMISNPGKKLKASVGEMASAKSTLYKKDKEGAYINAETMPEFKGGAAAIGDYINDHIDVPQAAIDDNKYGRVNVKFTVDATGKVMDAKEIGPKIGDGLDEEAVRAVASMPDWTPGTIKGKAVKVSLTMPVVFALTD
ncbi:MAG TPA: energy transducer TonB [Chitinophagaceae bacterium]|nr:energy transducer TonB [Chitinophagaceae bacterium]